MRNIVTGLVLFALCNIGCKHSSTPAHGVSEGKWFMNAREADMIRGKNKIIDSLKTTLIETLGSIPTPYFFPDTFIFDGIMSPVGCWQYGNILYEENNTNSPVVFIKNNNTSLEESVSGYLTTTNALHVYKRNADKVTGERVSYFWSTLGEHPFICVEYAEYKKDSMHFMTYYSQKMVPQTAFQKLFTSLSQTEDALRKELKQIIAVHVPDNFNTKIGEED